MICVWVVLGFVALVALWAIVDMLADYKAGEMWGYWGEYVEREAEAEEQRLWGIVVGANKRRRRVERYLSRERQRHLLAEAMLQRELVDLRVRNAVLEVDNKQLQSNHAALVEDVMTRMLNKRDEEVVVRGLTRKIPKE